MRSCCLLQLDFQIFDGSGEPYRVRALLIMTTFGTHNQCENISSQVLDKLKRELEAPLKTSSRRHPERTPFIKSGFP